MLVYSGKIISPLPPGWALTQSSCTGITSVSLTVSARGACPRFCGPSSTPPGTRRFEGVFLAAAELLSSGCLGRIVKIDMVADMPFTPGNK
jgi:hypothetical protein